MPTLRGLSHDPPAALAGGVICLIMMAVYAAYQVIVPELQRRRMERAHRKRLNRLRAMRALQRMDHKAFGAMFDQHGQFDTQIVDHMFDTFDADHVRVLADMLMFCVVPARRLFTFFAQNGIIDADELRAFLTGLALADEPDRMQEDVNYWMAEFDRNQSGTISKSEFRQELEKWVRAKLSREGMEDEITEVVISGPHTPEHEVHLIDVVK